MEYMCFNQTGDFSTLGSSSLKLVDKFTYLGSSVSSTETDIDTRLTKAWTAIYKLSVVWKSDLTDKMKRSFFQAVVVSILLHGCTIWTLTKRMEKKLDGNYTRMLRAILNKSWRQHPTKPQLYSHTECSPDDLPEAMIDREEWQEKVGDIRAGGTTWWWWYIPNMEVLMICFLSYRFPHKVFLFPHGFPFGFKCLYYPTNCSFPVATITWTSVANGHRIDHVAI